MPRQSQAPSSAAGDGARPSTVGDATSSNAWTNWFVAALFLVAALAAWAYFRPPWNFDLDSRDFSPFVFVPIALGAIGLWNLVPAVRKTLVGRKFGAATLELERETFVPGDALKGRIRTVRDLAPASDYEVTVQCVEQITQIGIGQKESTRDFIRWEALRKVAPAGVRSSEGIPFEFRIPESALTIGDERATGAVRWVLFAKAAMPGTDFECIFPLDVRAKRR